MIFGETVLNTWASAIVWILIGFGLLWMLVSQD